VTILGSDFMAGVSDDRTAQISVEAASGKRVSKLCSVVNLMRVNKNIVSYNDFVGARVAVHAPQFNGKLGEAVEMQAASNQRCPRNGKRTKWITPLPHSSLPLGASKRRLGRRWV
jgi:hypothetical protein